MWMQGKMKPKKCLWFLPMFLAQFSPALSQTTATVGLNIVDFGQNDQCPVTTSTSSWTTEAATTVEMTTMGTTEATTSTPDITSTLEPTTTLEVTTFATTTPEVTTMEEAKITTEVLTSVKPTTVETTEVKTTQALLTTPAEVTTAVIGTTIGLTTTAPVTSKITTMATTSIFNPTTKIATTDSEITTMIPSTREITKDTTFDAKTTIIEAKTTTSTAEITQLSSINIGTSATSLGTTTRKMTSSDVPTTVEGFSSSIGTALSSTSSSITLASTTAATEAFSTEPKLTSEGLSTTTKAATSTTLQTTTAIEKGTTKISTPTTESLGLSSTNKRFTSTMEEPKSSRASNQMTSALPENQHISIETTSLSPSKAPSSSEKLSTTAMIAETTVDAIKTSTTTFVGEKSTMDDENDSESTFTPSTAKTTSNADVVSTTTSSPKTTISEAGNEEATTPLKFPTSAFPKTSSTIAENVHATTDSQATTTTLNEKTTFQTVESTTKTVTPSSFESQGTTVMSGKSTDNVAKTISTTTLTQKITTVPALTTGKLTTIDINQPKTTPPDITSTTATIKKDPLTSEKLTTKTTTLPLVPSTSTVQRGPTPTTKSQEPPTSSFASSTATTASIRQTTTIPPAPLDPNTFLFCGTNPCASAEGYDAKISFSYHNRVGIDCSEGRCHGSFKSLKFQRVFFNGSTDGWSEVDNSTLKDLVWSIPITATLKGDFTREEIDAFLISVEMIDENGGLRTWNYTVKNNQSPKPGVCSVTPPNFAAMTQATFSCAGWTDEDGVQSYTFYSSGSKGVLQTNLGTTTSSSVALTLPQGDYNIFATATDNLKAISEKIFVQAITVTKGDITDAMNKDNKTLSDTNALIDSLKNSSAFDDRITNGTRDNLPSVVDDLIDYFLQNPNSPNLLETIKNALDNQLGDYTDGLSPEEIADMITDKMAQINDKKAQELASLIAEVNNVKINDGDSLLGVLQSTSNALKNSISFTLDADALKNSKVLYARIDTAKSNMILLNGYISVKNNSVYLEGDFRVAKFMENNNIDSFDLTTKYRNMYANIYLNGDDTSIVVYEGGTTQLPIWNTLCGLSMYGKTLVALERNVNYHQLITAWNITVDDSFTIYDTVQEIPNSTFSSFLLLSSGSYVTFPTLTTAILQQFTIGQAINIGETRLYFSIVTKDQTTAPVFMEISSGQLALKKSNTTVTLWITNPTWVNAADLTDKTGYNWDEFVPETFKIENISNSFIKAMVPGTNVKVNLEGVGTASPQMVTGFEGERELSITIDLRWLVDSSLTIRGTWSSRTAFKDVYIQGTIVGVSTGYFVFDDGLRITFLNGNIQYSGSTLFYRSSPNVAVQQLDNVAWDVSLADGIITFNVERAFVNKNSTDHYNTVIITSDGSEIEINKGVIYRNTSHGYIISYGELNTEGIELTNTGLSQQSLFNLEAQDSLVKIMGNVTDYLKNNGSELSEEELDLAANNILSIADDISATLEAAFKNPLSTVLQSSLAHEQANYNDLFNVLPQNPADIRYIEEYTEEEWAQEAAFLAQKAMAKKLIDSMSSMLSTLEDTAIQKFLASGKTSGSVSYTSGGTTMQVDIGTIDEILANPHMCDEWIVVLPPSFSDLNIITPVLASNDLIRMSLICQATNLFMYTDNAYYLVTSGTLNSTLKTIEGAVIPVEATIKPIAITGPNHGEVKAPTKMTYKLFDIDDILDIHSFVTSQWNGTLLIEIQPGEDAREVSDVLIFMGFQRIPGPLPNDHDWNTTFVDEKLSTLIFFNQNTTLNRTGRYFIGLGYHHATNDSTSVSYNDVTSQKVPEDYTFTKELAFTYSVKAISKGGYYLDPDEDRFITKGITPLMTAGENLTKFETTHMTVFSVGMFMPYIPSTFDYTTVVPQYEWNPTILITLFCILIAFVIFFLSAAAIDTGDLHRGMIINCRDNYLYDCYQYIVMVETGYRMIATTDSNVFIKLIGTEGETPARHLSGSLTFMGNRNTKLEWGRKDRFLLVTDRPLGDLKYLKIWIDLSGREYRQSWFCDHVEVKDLQTEKHYLFEVYNWFGNDGTDKKAFRHVEVTKKRSYLSEAFRFHNLADDILYLQQLTGGNGRFRMNFARTDMVENYFKSMIFTIAFACYIVYDVIGGETDPNARLIFPLFNYRITYIDILLGLGVGLFFTVMSHIFVVVNRITPSQYQLDDYHWLNQLQRRLYLYGNYVLVILIAIIYAVVDYILFIFAIGYIVKIGTQGNEGEITSITKVIFLGFIAHIFFEPIKAWIINVIMITVNRDYWMLSRYEKYCLNAFKSDAFKGLSKKRYDITVSIDERLQIDHDKRQRFRDDQFFFTMQEICIYFIQLAIMLGMLWFSRDSQAYRYQTNIASLFNAELTAQNPSSPVPFMKIVTVDDFWTWAQSDLTNGLLATWYDGNPAYSMRAFFDDKVSRSMGIGIIRQIRSKLNVNCQIDQLFTPFFNNCIGLTEKQFEDRTPAYSPGWKEEVNVTETRYAYIYRSQDELDGTSYSGNFDYYTGGGYTILLNGSISYIRAQLAQLQAENWIDQNTRALFVELSAYNAQINYFTVIKLVIEISPIGALEPSSWVETVRLFKYIDNKDAVVAFESLYIFLGICLLLREIYRMIRDKLSYFTSIWSYNSLFVIALLVTSIVVYFIRNQRINEAAEVFAQTNGNIFINLDKLKNLELCFLFTLSGTMFFTAIKMIHILRFNRRIDVLSVTLRNSGGSILEFALIFAFINMAFDMALLLLLSDQLEAYRNFGVLIQTTLAGILGKFTITDVTAVGFLATVIFATFMFTGTVLLVNIYIMLVMYQFEKARTDRNRQVNDFEFIDHIVAKTKMFFGRYQRSDIRGIRVPDASEYCQKAKDIQVKVEVIENRLDRMLNKQSKLRLNGPFLAVQ